VRTAIPPIRDRLDAHNKIARGTLQPDGAHELAFPPHHMVPVQEGYLTYNTAQNHTGAQSYDSDNVRPLYHPVVDCTSTSVTPQTPSSTPSSIKSSPTTRLPCTVCGRTFGRKGDLDRHSRKHVNAPRFYCQLPGCEFGIRGFDRRDKHDDHMRRGHKMIKVDGVWIWKEWATCVNGTWMVRE
jgi:hypothetical protein